MTGFWFKKNLFDGWDNLFHMIVPNIVMYASILLGVLAGVGINELPVMDAWKNIILFVAAFVFCGVLFVFVFAEGDNCALIANFESASLKNYFKNIVPSIKDGMLFGLLMAMIVAILCISFPFYYRIWVPSDGSKGSVVGLILMIFVFWFVVICLLSLQWFLPIRSLMHNGFRKCLRKSFILFFDNPGFTLVVALNNVLLIALSVICIGLVPGFTGVVLANTNALRLRLYKYDWYEVNPDLSDQERKQVPWDELLANDRETIGPRKFRNLLFPWKDYKFV